MATGSIGVPLRKRIGRACDQCRRRKTKCDGELKCKTCLDVGLQCSYGHQVRQARGPTYIVHLERKLKHLENQLRKTSVTSNPSDEGGVPGLEITTTTSSNSPLPALPQLNSVVSASLDWKFTEPVERSPSVKYADEHVEIIDSTHEAETSVGDGAVSIYRGNSIGIEIIRNLRRLCDSFVGLNVDPGNSAMKMANALDRPFPIHHLSLASMANVSLPSETQMHRWIDIAFNEAFTLWPFIDRRIFNFHVSRLLEQKNFGREKGDNDNLGLIHAVIALGQRYDPDLVDVGGDCFELGEVRGSNHFGAARDLVGLIDCNRSVTAVQTVLCMCIYLKSVSALRMVHTYVSMASYAAHQLGLHAAASASHLPERERVIRQRVYIALRMFDAYVTSSLGLPRNLRAIGPGEDTTESPTADTPEFFLAADANMELLDILGTVVEKAYGTDVITKKHASTSVQYKKLCEMRRKLEWWERKYPALTQITDNNLAICTKSQLFLRYSKCYVLLTLYCPFIHHVAKPLEDRSPNAYACGSKCIEVAIQAVRTAEALDIRGLLNEAYPLTVDVLAIAATCLLVVELGAPTDVAADTVRRTSRNAKTLLQGLAPKNSTAAQCLESLAPLYVKITDTAPAANASFEELMKDFTLFTTDNSDVPLFNFSSDAIGPNMFVASPPHDPVQTFNYPTIWPEWGHDNFAGPNFPPSLWV